MALNQLEARRRRIAWALGMYTVVGELRQQGLSQRVIATMLNEQGYRTFTGAMLNQQTISRLISGTRVNMEAGGS